jgi:hypothetical protein
LWEEAIEVARVEVEFPAGVAVSADDLRVMAVAGNWFFSGKGSFDWLPKSETRGTPVALKPSTSSASAPAGKNVLAFDGIADTRVKLAVVSGRAELDGVTMKLDSWGVGGGNERRLQGGVMGG